MDQSANAIGLAVFPLSFIEGAIFVDLAPHTSSYLKIYLPLAFIYGSIAEPIRAFADEDTL